MTQKINPNNTYKAIVSAARHRKCINYGALGKANDPDASWKYLWPHIRRHLDIILEESAKRGWPMITSIVVAKDDIETCELKDKPLNGFIDATLKLGTYSNEEDTGIFVKRHQQETFAWAQNPQPDSLDQKSSGKLGRFDSDAFRGVLVPFFQPILDFLRYSGGSAKGENIIEHIRSVSPVRESEFYRIKKGIRVKNKSSITYEGCIRGAGTRLQAAKLIKIKDNGKNLSYIGTEWTITKKGALTHLDYKKAFEINSSLNYPIKDKVVKKSNPPTVLEGKRQLKAHKALERKSQRRKKIALFIEENGILQCECCDMTGSQYSDAVRERTFEVHHRRPLSEAPELVETSLDDLAVLCANCHRAIHALPDVPSLEKFRNSIHISQSRQNS